MRPQIVWSPSVSDHFIVFSDEMTLYRAEAFHSESHSVTAALPTSTSYCALQLAVNANLEAVRCFAWHHRPEFEFLVAVGHANGQVSLTGPFTEHPDSASVLGKDIPCKHSRSCHCLAWNPHSHQLLAVGLDKYRAEPSLAIWDVFSYSLSSGRPVIESVPSETVHSCLWIKSSLSSDLTLAVGVAQKQIRIIDFRANSKPQSIVQTKAVYGLTANPHVPEHLISFGDNQLYMWDIRKFDAAAKPLVTITETKPIVEVEWDPCRNNCFSVLVKDARELHTYELHSKEYQCTDISLQPPFLQSNQGTLSSFNWHPQQQGRLLCLSANGFISDSCLTLKSGLSWAPAGPLLWASELNIAECTQPLLESEDLEILMKMRAERGYGTSVNNLAANCKLYEDNGIDSEIYRAWGFLERSRALQKETGGKTRFPGAFDVLKNLSQSQEYSMTLSSLTDTSSNLSMKQYRSTEREQLLFLAGLGHVFSEPKSFDAIMEIFMKNEELEKAASAFVLMLRLREAVEVLVQSDSEKLRLAALGLAGFQGVKDNEMHRSKNLPWHDVCKQLMPKPEQPYLRLIFQFLSYKLSPDGSWDPILQEPNLPFEAKLAFMALYLNDNQLKEQLEKSAKTLISLGNLSGLIITGLPSAQGEQLIANFVDRTGDVQTAALLSIHAGMNTASVESYLSLLNSWSMWKERSQLLALRKQTTGKASPAQIYVACVYCNRSAATKPKTPISAAACAFCKRPLPRCAICLAHVGTQMLPDQQPASNLDAWFTWCQNCRHGGHAKHLMQWFAEESECPVAGCQCKCSDVR